MGLEISHSSCLLSISGNLDFPGNDHLAVSGALGVDYILLLISCIYKKPYPSFLLSVAEEKVRREREKDFCFYDFSYCGAFLDCPSL